MKHLVLINQSTGYLTIDTINAYASKYDEVALVVGKISEAERRLAPKIKSNKIIAYDKSSVIKRILTWIIAFIQIFFVSF